MTKGPRVSNRRSPARASEVSPPSVASMGSKRGEDVAFQIESSIMELGWPVGTVIGSEQELMARYAVSRAVLREAIRIVEHHGAAQMRRGPGGGLLVSAPDPRAVQRPSTLYLDWAQTSTDDLFTARNALEMTCAGLVAANLDEEGIRRLRDHVAAERDAGPEGIATGAPHDLHVLIAELTGNPALHLFVEILARLTYERTHRQAYDVGEMGESYHAHSQIVEALIAGDGPLAQNRLRAHLSAALKYANQSQLGRRREALD